MAALSFQITHIVGQCHSRRQREQDMYMVGPPTHHQRDAIGIIDDSTDISEQTRQDGICDRNPILFSMEHSMYVVFHQ